MLYRHLMTPVVLVLLFSAGCSGSDNASPQGGADGWTDVANGDGSVPPGATTYGQVDDGKKGEKFRVTVTSDNEPIEVQFELYVNGKETEFDKKSNVKETKMEATLPTDGVVRLAMRNTTNAKTMVHYKIERHKGK